MIVFMSVHYLFIGRHRVRGLADFQHDVYKRRTSIDAVQTLSKPIDRWHYESKKRSEKGIVGIGNFEYQIWKTIDAYCILQTNSKKRALYGVSHSGLGVFQKMSSQEKKILISFTLSISILVFQLVPNKNLEVQILYFY